MIYAQDIDLIAANAYLDLQSQSQEIFILDQFIGGIQCSDMQKHIQFGCNINTAIYLVLEYEAVKAQFGDKNRKPQEADLNFLQTNSKK